MAKPTTPHMQRLYDAARRRPFRGIAAALLITAGGVLLSLAERLVDLPEGAVMAAAAEKTEHRNRKENPS